MSEQNEKLVKISHAWDNRWDIKSTEEAIKQYLHLKDKLRSIPQTLLQMEELARKDNFILPVGELNFLVDGMARPLLLANPNKLLRFNDNDSEDFWSLDLDLLMFDKFYKQVYSEEPSAISHSPQLIVDWEGRTLLENSHTKLYLMSQFLHQGKYTLMTIEEYDTSVEIREQLTEETDV